MTRLTLRIGIIVSAAGSCLLAATPAGTISSRENFEIDGTVVPVAAVPAWPVVAGDEITTLSSPAALTMRDGSKIVLRENSKVRIEQNGAKLRVRLVQGDMRFTLSNHARTEVSSLGYAPLPSSYAAGNVWTARKTAYVARDAGTSAVDAAPEYTAVQSGVESVRGIRNFEASSAGALISNQSFAPGLTLGRPPISAYRP